MQNSVQYTLASASATRAITSSTDATPIVIKSTAVHGLTTGDRVFIMGHTTNTNANGTWTVTVVDTDDFSLDGSVKTNAGAGGATGSFAAPAPLNIFCQDFETIQFTLDTDGGGDFAAVLKVCMSNSDTCPDFGKVQSVTNSYDYVDIIDLEDNASIDGDTGITYAGADDHRNFEVNTNGAKWFSVIPISGTAGELTIKATLFTRSV
jgi:hypothetical protein